MPKPKRPMKADPFDVWGKPPQIVLDQLGKQDHDRLRRYVERVTNKTYRIAYDCGLVNGLSTLTHTAMVELKRQQERMSRS